jgi:DNA repair photolyase
MLAPIIPALNDDEIPSILEAAATAGARGAGMQVVRLNREVAPVFTSWLQENYPQRAEKVLRGIRALHGGQLSDSQFGRRMRGTGPEAEALHALFQLVYRKHFATEPSPPLNTQAFRRQGGTQLPLFGGSGA